MAAAHASDLQPDCASGYSAAMLSGTGSDTGR